MSVKDGAHCPGCGLPNYEGLCPVCRGDYPAYEQELEPHFGPWFPVTPEKAEDIGGNTVARSKTERSES